MKINKITIKELIIFIISSVILIAGTLLQKLPFSMIEVFGFLSGGACVWLTVKENIWNWPIGIANSVFFIILFLHSKLYADMGLQVIYVVLGFLGWYWWLKGGNDKTALKVSYSNNLTRLVLLIITIFGVYFFNMYLIRIGDSAPFGDALTTIFSLVAQYLLTKKNIENWFIWIIADVIYIGLYFYKGLYLTGILYFIFLCMCFAGYYEWKKLLTHNDINQLQKEVLLK